MRQTLRWAVAVVILGTMACSEDATRPPVNVTEPPCAAERPNRNEDRVTVAEGVWGDVWFWKGDFMPICERGTIEAASREMRLHELTNLDDVEWAGGAFFTSVSTPLVATARSDALGFFQMEVPPGTYSLFAVEGERLYANGFDGQANIFPVRVEAGAVTGVRFDIDYEAYY